MNSNNSRTVGHVAFEEVFDHGHNYISFGGGLYKYDQGYYHLEDEGNLERRLAEYFSHYITDSKTEKCGYAADRSIKEAIRYVKSRCYVEYSLVNPPGLNLNNGYLKLSYDLEDQPIFELIPHSPKQYFTYKADFDYKPDAYSPVLSKALDEMLDEEEMTILLRNISAAFDLEKVRMRHARAVKAVVAEGQGSNGKDTIRVWVGLLFGGVGLTSIPLQVFKKADSDRVFGLYPLLNSKINWASENKSVAIDSCQTLKEVITGEPVTIERKHEQPITIIPHTVCIFNVNDLPVLESGKEAISSRYAVIRFKNTFKSNPDPSKPEEKQADPRLKQDANFIKKNILTALLNILIKEYELLLADGIDYSSQAKLLEEIRVSNSHFYEFIVDSGLVECELEDGLEPKDLYDNYYVPWCVEQRMINESSISDHYIYNDPNQYDKVLKDYRSITKQLKKFFPKLKFDRIKGRRRIGIRVNVLQLSQMGN